MKTTLQWWMIRQLENQGCTATDWTRVKIHPDTDLKKIRNVAFSGDVSVGLLSLPEAEIVNARLHDVTVGNEAAIRNIGDRISGCSIGHRAMVVNVGSVTFQPEALCGVGTVVNVLDETGSRPVRIYPGISAQMALLLAREPKWVENEFDTELTDYIQSFRVMPAIGDDAVVINCGRLRDVAVGNEVRVEGARALVNGVIINNAAPGKVFAGVGDGVDAENFIIEDAFVGSGCTVRNSYIGQGVVLEKGFTAHDSLFFANCSMENGEACALFAGPYTVSMHKSSLLIGCQTSFMNAGSGTNQSNHMYKLGPVHWGILERGVKTASGSYLMLGAKIGAFSLLMGQHKTHPDSSQFPFSYLFGDDRGATVVVPGAMLRSCGLMRDETKWPKRDRRLKRRLPLHDRINFEVLNPLTVDRMLDALEVIDSLLTRETDDDRFVRYKGMKFTRASLERAKNLYFLAINKYLYTRLGDRPFPNPEDFSPDGGATHSVLHSLHLPSMHLHASQENAMTTPEWIDMAGQLITRDCLHRAMQAGSVEEIEKIFTEEYENFDTLERRWMATRFGSLWRQPREVMAVRAGDFDKMIEEDRQHSREELLRENSMLRL